MSVFRAKYGIRNNVSQPLNFYVALDHIETPSEITGIQPSPQEGRNPDNSSYYSALSCPSFTSAATTFIQTLFPSLTPAINLFPLTALSSRRLTFVFLRRVLRSPLIDAFITVDPQFPPVIARRPCAREVKRSAGPHHQQVLLLSASRWVNVRRPYPGSITYALLTSYDREVRCHPGRGLVGHSSPYLPLAEPREGS